MTTRPSYYTVEHAVDLAQSHDCECDGVGLPCEPCREWTKVRETLLPRDNSGAMRPDWVGGGRWRTSYGSIVDFDRGLHTCEDGEVSPLDACWETDDADGWTRILGDDT